MRRSLAGGLFAVTLALAASAPAEAQRGPVDGYVSVGIDHLPSLDDGNHPGTGTTPGLSFDQPTELRTRVFLERAWTLGSWKVRAAGLAEGLVADRDRTRRDGHLQIREATVAWSGGAFDVRAGIGTIVWGRLDEVQPTDVINPLDAAKYLLAGRADARLPVTHARVRWFAGERATVEGVWVPLFTRGRYDVLDEATSPFNLLADARRCTPSPACPPVSAFLRHEPPRSLRTSQGGVRVSATTGRADWAVAVYSGYPGFGRIGAGPIGLPPGTPPDFLAPILVFETYPRFTIYGGDVETVRGDWAIRGEAALTTGDTVVTAASPFGVDGRSVRAGAGADRKAGSYRLSGTVLVERRDATGYADTNVSLVVGGERPFAGETRKVRLFGAWNIADRSGFARAIGTWSLRDNLALEGTVGWFLGDGDDTISRFADRDFVALSLKAYF